MARGLTVFLYGLGTYFFAFTITSLIIKINQQKNRPKWHCVLCLTSTSSVHYTRQPQSSAWSGGDICAFLCLSQGHSYCENSHVRCTSLYFWVFMPFGLLDNFCWCAATQVGKEVPFLNTTRRPYASAPNRASEGALPKDTRPDRSPTQVLTPPDSAWLSLRDVTG